MGKDGDKKRFIIETHSLCYLHLSKGPDALITAAVFAEKLRYVGKSRADNIKGKKQAWVHPWNPIKTQT